MVNLETADKALKTVYLGVVSEQLNVGVNPLLAKIEQTQSDVWGKDIVKLVTYGLNGGVGAGNEIGELPTAYGNNYAQFKLELKNLYGTIEISDKAIRASESNTGAFVNLLNAEMEGLLKASKFNLGRMLYGDGSGIIAKITTAASSSKSIVVNSVKCLMEGMVIDIHSSGEPATVRIVSVDRSTKTVILSQNVTVVANDTITVQGSKGHELTGLGAIFSDNDLYGVKRADNHWLKPYTKGSMGVMDTAKIQEAIDYVDEVAGSPIDFILCAYDVKRMYLDCLSTNRTNIDYMNLDGGYKAMTYNGIPLVSDRFVEDGDMYLLNSADFKLHQLCDWRWLEGDSGKVIKQKQGYPTYTATLVKYADLICDKPIGQVKLSGFTYKAN